MLWFHEESVGQSVLVSVSGVQDGVGEVWLQFQKVLMIIHVFNTVRTLFMASG